MQKSVLIVEDDEDMRTTLIDLLTEEVGCSIIGTQSVAQTEETISTIPLPDLVILDGTVKDGSTLRLIAFLRNKGYANFIIAHSNSAESTQKMVAAGCLPLPKGQPNALIHLVRVCLELGV